MKRILIIEDDTDINNMTADALRKAGYACTQAFSGTEGLMRIEHELFDLVVMDLMLPGMDGEVLLPQIKAKQAVPVLVVSAKDSLDSKIDLLTAGAEDYMTKPFDIRELVARTRVSSGLGLSIAKGLAEKMNGTITAALQDDRFAVELRFPEAKDAHGEGEPKKPDK